MTEQVDTELQSATPNGAALVAQSVARAPSNDGLRDAPSPMELLSRALDRGADIAVLEKLMDLQERYEKNEARKAFDAAMADAKAEIPTIRKNRHVGFGSKNGGAKTDYMHEDLAEIARVVTPILSKYGLSYRFRTHYEPNMPVSVTCILSHRQGYSEENTLPGPPDSSGNKNSIQAIGSTVTYLQRYTLKAALGLAAAADDDAQGANDTEGDEPITDDQRAELSAKAEKVGADLEKFCAYIAVANLGELRQRDFAGALAKLDEKKRKAAAK